MWECVEYEKTVDGKEMRSSMVIYPDNNGWEGYGNHFEVLLLGKDI